MIPNLREKYLEKKNTMVIKFTITYTISELYDFFINYTTRIKLHDTYFPFCTLLYNIIKK
jgi:hypothetical protein